MNRKTSGIVFSCVILFIFFAWKIFLSNPDSEEAPPENEKIVTMDMHSRTTPNDPPPMEATISPVPQASPSEQKAVAEQKPVQAATPISTPTNTLTTSPHLSQKPKGSVSLDQIGWNGKRDPNGRRLGWIKDGRTPEDYDFGTLVDEKGDQEAFIRAHSNLARPFASLTDISDFSQYAGTDIQVSADILAVDTELAGVSLYARANDANKKILTFNKTILKRTTGWQNVSVKLSVPQDVQEFFFGIIMNGKGSVSIKNVDVEAIN
jgi:hypothetical protein